MKLAEILPREQGVVLNDDQTYTFSTMHLNAQAAIEEKFGMEFLSGDSMSLELFFGSLAKSASLRFVAHQLLLKNHPDITETQVGYLISPVNQALVLRAVVLSIANSLPIPEEKKKEVADAITSAMVEIPTLTMS